MSAPSLTDSGGYANNQAYDGAENQTTFKGVNAAFNSGNQNTDYTHDGNGNPTAYKGSTLALDAENRMTSFGSILTAGASLRTKYELGSVIPDP